MRKYTSAEYADLARGNGKYDCWGLAMAFYADEYGIKLKDYAYESTEDFKANAYIYQDEYTNEQWIKTTKPSYGDLIVFNILGHPVHVGIMVDSQSFLHAHKSIGVGVEKLDSHFWSRRIEGIYRHKRKPR